jgi:hypothetical protein
MRRDAYAVSIIWNQLIQYFTLFLLKIFTLRYILFVMKLVIRASIIKKVVLEIRISFNAHWIFNLVELSKFEHIISILSFTRFNKKKKKKKKKKR